MKALMELVNKNITLFEESIKITRLIKSAANQDNVEEAVNLVENRDRLINIITETQQELIEKIAQVEGPRLTTAFVNYLKNWKIKVNSSVATIKDLDSEILICLENSKNEAMNKVATMLQNIQKVRNYDSQNI